MLPPPATLSSNLPIIQKATEAYKLWHGFHNKFPRVSKFTLGNKIDGIFIEMLERLFMARFSSEPDQKLGHLRIAGAKLDMLNFLLQISWELKILDHKKFAALAAPLNEIGKMLGGWKKQMDIK